MRRLAAMKAVYCYYLPETRPVLREIERALPDELWRVTTPAALVRDRLRGLFDPPLDIPETPDGAVSVDEIHGPVIARIVASYARAVPHLGSFAHAYPTAGSSEGIFHLLAHYRTEGHGVLNLLAGEYEGYSEYAGHLGMSVRWFDSIEDGVRAPAGDPWFISNPSARDGNIIPNELIRSLCGAGHRVVLDFSYAGSTRDYPFDAGHPNIDAAFLSFSKPYGAFRFRCGGFTFARRAIPSLYATKWFKDTLRLLQALALAERIGPHAIHGRYHPAQREIIDRLNADFELPLAPSDSFLLAYVAENDAKALTAEQAALLAPYRRGRGYRLCLTPYFEMREQSAGAGS